MPGFNLSIGDMHFTQKSEEHLKCNFLKKENYVVNRYTIKKFQDDKIFYDSNEYLILLEGVILNKKKYHKTDEESWPKKVIDLYQKYGETFYKKFKGSFSGFFYDKKINKWIIFNDHIGSKHVYYHINNEELYVSSEIVDLYNFFKENNINYSLNKKGAYMLLSYGYMLDDCTLCNEIKKLKHGSYIICENGHINIYSYYSLTEEYDKNISEEEAIERVDQLFRNAIQLQFEKDREYNYKHIVPLSGGLDSRMTSWVAHDMGYTDQLNFTFSQTDYLDETIAKRIAADLKHEWIFKALDNGLFLKNLDLINKISGGNIIYYTLAHGYSGLKNLNMDNYGILHKGLLGDILKGDYYEKIGVGAFSKKLLHKVDYEVTRPTSEHSITRQRAFNGIHFSNVLTNRFTETMSPFYDLDFLNMSLKLPPKIRIHRSIYKKWILKKYPGAAEYIWEATGGRIDNRQFSIPYKGKNIPLSKLPSKILRKLGIMKGVTHYKFHMNPLDYWYKTNSDLKVFQDTYFKDNIDRLNKYSIIKKDSKLLYFQGTAIEKNQVLTLLSSLKLFF